MAAVSSPEPPASSGFPIDYVYDGQLVLRNGKVLRTIPISLGKPSTPSSSGTMVVMEKKESTVFDTRDDPDPQPPNPPAHEKPRLVVRR